LHGIFLFAASTAEFEKDHIRDLRKEKEAQCLTLLMRWAGCILSLFGPPLWWWLVVVGGEQQLQDEAVDTCRPQTNPAPGTKSLQTPRESGEVGEAHLFLYLAGPSYATQTQYLEIPC
jgi:hypothetical protein